MPTDPLDNYIRMHRARHALSQAEVAFLIGCGSAATVARYEGGQREPQLDVALALQALFNVPPGELFAGRFRKVEHSVVKRARELLERLRSKGPSPATTAKLQLLVELARTIEHDQ